MFKIAILVLALLGTAANAAEADGTHVRQLADGASSPPAQLQDIAWIAGHWQGEAFGGTVEEVWSAPLADGMMGMFRLVADGQTSFYELMVIRQVADTIILQLKHFHGDLRGWEEKDETVDFPLVAATNDRVWFSGLTFERISDDELHVWVLVGGEDDEQEMPFKYRRSP